MSPLLKWLGIVREHEERVTYELTRGRLQTDHAALNELDRMSHVYFTEQTLLDNLRSEYKQRMEHDTAFLAELNVKDRKVQEEESKWANRHLLLVEKNEIIGAFHQGAISQVVYKRLLANIDKRLLQLDT